MSISKMEPINEKPSEKLSSFQRYTKDLYKSIVRLSHNVLGFLLIWHLYIDPLGIARCSSTVRIRQNVNPYNYGQ